MDHADSSRSAALDFLEGHDVTTVAVADLDNLPWAAHQAIRESGGVRPQRVAGTYWQGHRQVSQC